jgi:hypothetical protein
MNETRHVTPSSSRSNYFPDMSDYVMPSASRSNYFPDICMLLDADGMT